MPPKLKTSLVFVFGSLVGIYLQHKWPVGRWRAHSAPPPIASPVTPSQLAAIPEARTLVVAVVGQSNAANYGTSRAEGGPGVYIFYQNSLFNARDPLPGGDQFGGSPWTRLGAALMLTGKYDAIVFTIHAKGSSRVADWAPGGRLHPALMDGLKSLISNKLNLDFIFWHQGESEAWSPHSSGREYLQQLEELMNATREIHPNVHWLVAQATWGQTIVVNSQIRRAQKLAGALSGASPGPDLDNLGAAFRHDGVHFNTVGLEAVAALWLEAIESPRSLSKP